MEKRIFGSSGEDIALKYLMRRGYKLLERNFRAGRNELDLIMQYKDLLVFVEVKTRRNESFGLGREAVDYRKQQHIISAAQFYIAQVGNYDNKVRFDVIEVKLPEGKVVHIENAFMT